MILRISYQVCCKYLILSGISVILYHAQFEFLDPRMTNNTLMRIERNTQVLSCYQMLHYNQYCFFQEKKKKREFDKSRGYMKKSLNVG